MCKTIGDSLASRQPVLGPPPLAQAIRSGGISSSKERGIVNFTTSRMSSTSIPEKLYYFSKAFQRKIRERVAGKEDWVIVDFYLLKKSSFCYDRISDIRTERSFTRKVTSIPLSNAYHHLIEPMARHLSIMGVPQEQKPTILSKLFEVVRVCRPERRIIVLIGEVKLSVRGSFNDFDTLDRLTRANPDLYQTIRFGRIPSNWIFERYELCDVDYHHDIETVLLGSFETLTLKIIPATRSAIESLQKVRLDSLEEATIRQNSPCSVCQDEFAEGSVDQLITPLPCKHHFHADCISQWLERSHVCPLCRYALPIVEHSEPSNS